MTVRAIIVGVETYGEATMKVESPAANAVAMAEWLLEKQVAAPADIHLLLAPAQGDPAAALRAEGVKVGVADWGSFDTVVRELLTQNCPTGSHLLFYWSGHGAVDERGDRILFCEDYSRTFDNRVVNADLFLRLLTTPEYACFDDTLALLDVCGTWTDYPITPPVYRLNAPSPRPQLVYYAAPEGHEALASTEAGSFSYSAFRALRDGGWPDFEAFSGALDKELAELEIPRLRVWMGTGTDRKALTYGREQSNLGGVLKSLVTLIHETRIGAMAFNRHYDAVTYDVNNFNLSAAQSVAERVTALSRLEDPYRPLTGGLIQFVLRLSAEPEGGRLLTWLDENADAYALSSQKEKISRESAATLLIMQVEIDERGQFVNLKPSVRDTAFALVQGRTFPDCALKRWRDVEAGFAAVLSELKQLDLLRDLEIHVVVEAQCFDRAFHQLPGVTPGRKLGEDFVVVVHHMHRLRGRSGDETREWQRQARALIMSRSEDRVWRELPGQGTLPDETALWFAGFPLSTVNQSIREKDRLDRLVRLGAPFVYWAHERVAPDTAQTLARFVQEPKRLKTLPSELKRQRLGEDPVACGGTLLWDDPDFDPFTEVEGVSRP